MWPLQQQEKAARSRGVVRLETGIPGSKLALPSAKAVLSASRPTSYADLLVPIALPGVLPPFP